jgi:all-trans-retinol dehydrogenase (NAD+)
VDAPLGPLTTHRKQTLKKKENQMGKGIPLSGSRVLITGGGSGIGRLMALGAAVKGADVTVWDLDADRAACVREEVAKLGATGSSLGIDVTDREAVYEAARAGGEVDVLINNAGVVGGRPLLEEPDDAIRRTLEVDLVSLFWVTKAFLPGMVERHRGTVVTVSSAAGMVAGAKMTDYAAAKFGAIGFNEALRNEMRQERTGVNTMIVCPFYIDTGMFDGVKTRIPWLLPILKPKKVAAEVLFGIERGAKQVILPPFVRIVPMLRLVPVTLMDWTADLFGINRSMEDFAGRPGDRA